MGKRYSCHKISEGKADGEALVSLDDIMFYLIKPETGVVIEPSHDLYGKSMAKKILMKTLASGNGAKRFHCCSFYILKRALFLKYECFKYNKGEEPGGGNYEKEVFSYCNNDGYDTNDNYRVRSIRCIC